METGFSETSNSMASSRYDISNLVPHRNLKWEDAQNGKIILIVPKFRNRLAVKFLLPFLPKPDIRIHLDDLGSFVWKNCDGHQTVSIISSELLSSFGSSTEQAHSRTARFIRILHKENFITLQ